MTVRPAATPLGSNPSSGRHDGRGTSRTTNPPCAATSDRTCSAYAGWSVATSTCPSRDEPGRQQIQGGGLHEPSLEVAPLRPRVGEEQVHGRQPTRTDPVGEQLDRVADLDPEVRHAGRLRRREHPGDTGHVDVDGEHVVVRVRRRIRDGRSPVSATDLEDHRCLAPERLTGTSGPGGNPREGRYRSSRSPVSADRLPCRPAYVRTRPRGRAGLGPVPERCHVPTVAESNPSGVTHY